MKLNKKIAILLAGVMCVSAFVGCSNNNSGNNGGNGGTNPTKPTQTVPDADQHLATGTLHKVNVTESSRAFVTTGAVAKRLGREYIGIDINARYLEKAQERIDRIAY